jgi:hypothetical protein
VDQLLQVLMNRQLQSQNNPPTNPAFGLWSGSPDPGIKRPQGWTMGGPEPGGNPFEAKPPQGVSGRMATPPPPDRQSLPSPEKRWETGQKMQDAYANGWEPNPMLIRAQAGQK